MHCKYLKDCWLQYLLFLRGYDVDCSHHINSKYVEKWNLFFSLVKKKKDSGIRRHIYRFEILQKAQLEVL